MIKEKTFRDTKNFDEFYTMESGMLFIIKKLGEIEPELNLIKSEYENIDDYIKEH